MHIAPQLLLLISLVSFPSAPSRISPLFDDYYTSIGIAAENARLNNYAIQLKNAPESRAFIIVYAENERTVKRAQARARRVVKYLGEHGINNKRTAWRYERPCGTRKFSCTFWIRKKPTHRPMLGYASLKMTRRTNRWTRAAGAGFAT